MLQTVSQELFNIDIRTLFFVLAWGNLILAFLVFVFKTSIPFARDKPLLSYCLYSRALHAAAFFLLFCRGLIPDALSVNMGNSLLLYAFYWESKAMLAIIYEEGKIYSRITGVATLVCVTAFNIAEYMNPDPSMRTSAASLCVFLILCVPAMRMTLSRGIGTFKKTVSLLYIVFLVMILLRTFADVRFSIFDNGSPIQSLTLLSLIFLMIFSLPSYLLLTKEITDKALLDMATTDALTGLRNRHAFFTLADQLYQNRLGNQSHLSVLFMDIDNFKQINDAHGHDFGDAVLVSLADILKKLLRPVDLYCRYGGEEFVVLLPRADAWGTNLVGRRIMRKISETIFESHPGFTFTVSIGVSSDAPRVGQSLEEHIALADKALYAAKTTGKNKIVTNVPNCQKHEIKSWGDGAGNIKVDEIVCMPDFTLLTLQPSGGADEDIQ